ncbi:hypothetical protein EVAR_8214_1 [Eumeta japonica]|uniref:Uncharacterized protein n=1 Tax=Eumeta variegata TaxID=151549 RepID=A0A4C1TJ10_EUMVA|nr:hypothetical protein EVAR_8214_1 [Eumeta japonica]
MRLGRLLTVAKCHDENVTVISEQPDRDGGTVDDRAWHLAHEKRLRTEPAAKSIDTARQNDAEADRLDSCNSVPLDILATTAYLGRRLLCGEANSQADSLSPQPSERDKAKGVCKDGAR